MISLRELIAQHPHAFYHQTWYLDEAFMDDRHEPPTGYALRAPISMGHTPTSIDWLLPHAVQLAARYVERPNDAIWEHYLWCVETDRHGQRVYVGQNGRGLEIHRHLNLSPRWAITRFS